MSHAYLEDAFRRRFSYLRLSITDQCNFRCGYCLPHGYQKDPTAAGYLTLAEIENLVGAFAELGTWKVRITGGEPTARRDLLDIVRAVRATPGIKTVALSTNGQKLSLLAKDLREAGVSRLNISIDSLDRARFAEITGVDALPRILTAIEEALALDFSIKINAVLLKGRNDTEIDDFVDYVKNRPVSVRWIELMPTDQGADYFRRYHLKSDELKNRLVGAGWSAKRREDGDGPALEMTHPDSLGRLGLIAPYAKDFCSTCNRLRVTARGELRLCLFGESNTSLRPMLQAKSQREALKAHIRELLTKKEVSHFLSEGNHGINATFSAIGG